MFNSQSLPRLCLVAIAISSITACGSSSSDLLEPPPVVQPPATPSDTSPDAFSFSAETNVLPDTLVQSSAITVTGIDTATSVSIEGGEYAIDDGEFTSEAGEVNAGQTITVRVQSGSDSGESVSATLTIGDQSAVFEVSTRGANAIPGTAEAEFAILAGNTALVDNALASGGQAVNGFLVEQDAVVFENAPQSVAVRVTYSGNSASAIRISLEDGVSVLTDAAATTDGNFADVIAQLNVMSGQQVSVGTTDASGTWQLDKVQWIDTALQQVRTFANSGIFGGDGLSVSETGDIYVSGGLGAGEVYRINSQGEVSTFATGFASANGSAFDSAGNLFVADYYGNSVHMITPNGESSVFAEGLDGPSGLYVDQQDNVIVGQFGAGFSGTAATVLSFTPEGEQSILATGNGLMDVIGVVGDDDGNIYAGNWSSGELYRITDGDAELIADLDVTINMIDYGRGYIYIGNSGVITRVSISGESETFSGNSMPEEINGPVADANFVDPVAVAFSANKNILYVYDGTTSSIRSISFAD